MNPIEQAILRAHEQGRPPQLAELGGEEAVVGDTALAVSHSFGDIVDALTTEWSTLTSAEDAALFISNGLRHNLDRVAFTHAISSLVYASLNDVRPFVFALEARNRDETASDLLRVEAAAGLMRFALQDRRWKSSALAALHAIENTNDYSAGSMLCRLASLAFEQFRDSEALALLERRIDRAQTIAQATFERGVIEISLALEQEDISAVSGRLRNAAEWLRYSTEAADRRDARVYLLLTEALLPLTTQGERPSHDLAEELRQIAIIRHMWDVPAPGTDWLLPSHDAELEWINLVDDLLRLSHQLAEPSWMDAARVLGEVVRVYSSDRAVRTGLAGTGRVVRPVIEAAFLRERGLLAHLDQWLELAKLDTLNAHEAQILRSNIQNRSDRQRPPGKAQRAASPGQKPSSKN